MEENILAWNFENWITVVLMVAIGFAVLTLISQGVKSSRAFSSAEGATGMSNAPPIVGR